MKITARLRTFLLAALPLLTSAAHADITVKDDKGDTVSLKQPAKRIVSLAPHLTELLYAAGGGAQLVGTVDYSDYPPAAKQLPRVGGYSRIDLEAVAGLKPDLILAWDSGNTPAHIARLRQLGLPVFVSQPNRIDDLSSLLERLGAISGHAEEGSGAARAYRERLAKLRATYSQKPKVRTFYQVWQQPLTTVGGQQIISDAIRVCGGDNVFGQLEALAPKISVEAVLAANPEAIVASGMGEARPDWVNDWKRWPRLTAAQRDNLFYIPPDLIQRHTPRLLDGTERMCGYLETARQRRPR
jgi:iron complex transport system substrate-binding protein